MSGEQVIVLVGNATKQGKFTEVYSHLLAIGGSNADKLLVVLGHLSIPVSFSTWPVGRIFLRVVGYG